MSASCRCLSSGRERQREGSAAAGVVGGGEGAMRARGHGGAEMAKVGCRVDARADRGVRERKKRGREGRWRATHTVPKWCV